MQILWRHDGNRSTAQHSRYANGRKNPYVYTLRVVEQPSGFWHASVQLEGASAECLGDAFRRRWEAQAACERHVLIGVA